MPDKLYSYNSAMKIAKYENKRVTRKSWGAGRYLIYDTKSEEFYFIHFEHYPDGSISFTKHVFNPFHSDLCSSDWMVYTDTAASIVDDDTNVKLRFD